MSEFHFIGHLPASKSLLNRILILQSYFKDIRIIGDSICDDVVWIKRGLVHLFEKRPIDCGESAAVFRFLALRASRQPGLHTLRGSRRLLSRPQKDLGKVLMQLGMGVQWGAESLEIKSQGWKTMGDSLHVPCDRSSQFASAVLLNAWKLSQPFYFSLGRQMVSFSYWKMTLQLIRYLGLKVESWGNDYYIPPHQSPQVLEYEVETDAGCSFAIAALAAVAGTATLRCSHLQPDSVFVDVLKEMNVPVRRYPRGTLRVKKSPHLLAIKYNLGECPDLFPVLAAICSQAHGESHLYGGWQLPYKESHRILKMAELLKRSGCRVEILSDGLKIEKKDKVLKEFDFDTDSDHRLAMAAGVLRKCGVPVNIVHPEVVSKSFPGYWDLFGRTH